MITRIEEIVRVIQKCETVDKDWLLEVLQAPIFKEASVFYILKSDMQRVNQGCDLGDSVGVRVYLHPHVSQMPDMLQCSYTMYLTV